jgi:hypothetical protein
MPGQYLDYATTPSFQILSNSSVILQFGPYSLYNDSVESTQTRKLFVLLIVDS